MFFKKSNPLCPICHDFMTAVDRRDVPKEALREFARLNKWRMLCLNGWFLCAGCSVHIHVPTVRVIQRHRF